MVQAGVVRFSSTGQISVITEHVVLGGCVIHLFKFEFWDGGLEQGRKCFFDDCCRQALVPLFEAWWFTCRTIIDFLGNTSIRGSVLIFSHILTLRAEISLQERLRSKFN